MQLLIPDTNFLIYLVKYKLLDEIEHYKIIIIKQIIEELEKIINNKRTKVEDKVAASIALTFLKTRLKIRKARIEKQEGKTDDAIIASAKKLGAKIGTMDKELSKKAEKEKIKVIKIRQKKYLK